MKKLLGSICVVLCFFALVACDNHIEREFHAVGTWHDHFHVNDLYTNEFMGLQFQLPNSWRAFTIEELEAYDNFLEIGLLSVPRIDPNLLSINGDLRTDMVALNLSARPGTAVTLPDAGTVQMISGQLSEHAMNRTQLDALELMFQRMPKNESVYTALELLEIIQNDLGAQGTTRSRIYDHPITIGRYEFYFMQIAVESTNHVTLERRIYVNLEEKDVRIVVITDFNSERIDVIMAYLDELGTPILETVGLNRENEILDSEELIGEWIWNGDNCSSHTFHADGSGVQRHCGGYSRDFGWMIFDGAVFIDFEETLNMPMSFVRIFQTSLVDDTLILTGFYSPETIIEIYTRGKSVY